MNIYLVRHGQTIENSKNIIMGQKDGILSKKGEKQAASLGQKLKKYPLDFIYCSNSKRAKDTLTKMKRDLSRTNVRYSDELIEINFGKYIGKNIKHFKLYESNKNLMTVRPSGGETLEEVRDRVKYFINLLKEKHKNENILIMTHGGIVLMIISILKKIPFENLLRKKQINNACIYKLEI